MSATLTIKEERVKQAYADGCEDVRSALVALFPEVLAEKWADITDKCSLEGCSVVYNDKCDGKWYLFRFHTDLDGKTQTLATYGGLPGTVRVKDGRIEMRRRG